MKMPWSMGKAGRGHAEVPRTAYHPVNAIHNNGPPVTAASTEEWALLVGTSRGVLPANEIAQERDRERSPER